MKSDVNIADVRRALACCPARPQYVEWFRIVSAVGNTFDKHTAESLLTERFGDEKMNEHSRKIDKRGRNITIGTLFYIAKQYNPTFKPEKTDAYFAPPLPKPQYSRPEIRENAIFAASGERLLRYAVNTAVVNKTTDYAALTNGFCNAETTLAGLIEYVRRGAAICNAQMKGRRANENFIRSEIVLLDIDNGEKINGEKIRYEGARYMTMHDIWEVPFVGKYCNALWTSPSSTPQWERFRLLFIMPFCLADAESYRAVVRKHIKNVPFADKAATAACQVFFGNTNAIIKTNSETPANAAGV